MADLAYRTDTLPNLPRATDWSAIWVGMFTFVAIWSVFGFLGFAILAQPAAPTASVAATTNIGLGIWALVLTVIAMFVAGHVTGRLARLDGRREGAVHGMTMFGLTIVAAAVLTMSGRFLFGGLSGGPALVGAVPSPYVLGMFAGSGWIAFIALFLGWLGAMIGGASAAAPGKAIATSNVRDMRTAA